MTILSTAGKQYLIRCTLAFPSLGIETGQTLATIRTIAAEFQGSAIAVGGKLGPDAVTGKRCLSIAAEFAFPTREARNHFIVAAEKRGVAHFYQTPQPWANLGL